MEIIKYRWWQLTNRVSIHFTTDEKLYYYSYDASWVCCVNAKLCEINNRKYKKIWKMSYCHYNDSETKIQALEESWPQLVKDINKWVETHDWTDIW